METVSYFASDARARPRMQVSMISLRAPLAERYGLSEGDLSDALVRAASQLAAIEQAIGSVQGKVILDLGCGSVASAYDYGDGPGRYWEPWLCRALHYLGARPIGIDLAGLDGEPFEHYHLDLSKPGSLSFLPDASVDLANASFFFDSPTLEDRTRADPDAVFAQISEQLERIVRPGGYFLHDHNYPYGELLGG